MRDVMVGHVERGEVPGLVTLVSRRGEAHVEAIGVQARGGPEPMRRDTIFRIASTPVDPKTMPFDAKRIVYGGF